MSRFHTVEVSDARYEHDHLRSVTVKSPSLKGRGDITLFVPPGCEAAKKLPLILLLHGIYGSHWAWALKGGAHKTALKLIEARAIRPMVLAMPSDGLWGDGSGYFSHDGADFEKWIVEDVVDCVREVVPQTDGGVLFISGLSMGGYGAMRIGARQSGKFSGISAHSSSTHIDQLIERVQEPIAKAGNLSDDEKSVAHWLVKAKAQLPPLRFDCGVEDTLIEHNRTLRRALLDAGVKHEYQEFPGVHNWDYWREHITDTLKFFERLSETRP